MAKAKSPDHKLVFLFCCFVVLFLYVSLSVWKRLALRETAAL